MLIFASTSYSSSQTGAEEDYEGFAFTDYEEPAYPYPPGRSLVGIPERFVLGASEREFTSGDGDHADAGVGPGDRFGEGLEGGDVGRGVVDLSGTGVYLLPVVQLLVLVAGDLMPGVEVA